MKNLLRWIPALLFMAVIFILSSFPAEDLPHLGLWDTLVKKGGHFAGYGLLAMSYWCALGWKKNGKWLALGLALIYALSDEFHQSFVPGRHASWIDALIIDGSGAFLALGLTSGWLRRWRTTP